MYNADLKDKVLSYLVDKYGNCGLCQISVDAILTGAELTFEELLNLFEEFASMGLISDLNMRYSATWLCVTHKARVLIEKGGFCRQAAIDALAYENLRLQYKALQAELENIKLTNPMLVERTLNFIGNLASVAGIFLG